MNEDWIFSGRKRFQEIVGGGLSDPDCEANLKLLSKVKSLRYRDIWNYLSRGNARFGRYGLGPDVLILELDHLKKEPQETGILWTQCISLEKVYLIAPRYFQKARDERNRANFINSLQDFYKSLSKHPDFRATIPDIRIDFIDMTKRKNRSELLAERKRIGAQNCAKAAHNQSK